MPRLSLALMVGLLWLATPARAVIIGPTHDPHDTRAVVAEVADDPRVVASREGLDAFRKRILRWKGRDFLAFFGKPVVAFDRLDDALMAAEARVLGLSGLRSANPADNKDHVEAYPVGDLGHLVVYFGHDGESPVYALVYLKADADFPKLDHARNLAKRLAWERPRFARLAEEVDRRRRKAIGWEVDPEAEKARSRDLDSGDFAAKIRAVERWAQEPSRSLRYRPPEGDEGPSWEWSRGTTPAGRAYHDRGFKGAEATPSHFEFDRPDGTLLRDESGWPSLEMIRWYRPGGEAMAYVETGSLRDGAWRAEDWTWYDARGEFVRLEADSNGDGVPDVRGESALVGREHLVPMTVEESWAVNPDLIPKEVRNPGQPERRVPLREIRD